MDTDKKRCMAEFAAKINAKKAMNAYYTLSEADSWQDRNVSIEIIPLDKQKNNQAGIKISVQPDEDSEVLDTIISIEELKLLLNPSIDAYVLSDFYSDVGYEVACCERPYTIGRVRKLINGE